MGLRYPLFHGLDDETHVVACDGIPEVPHPRRGNLANYYSPPYVDRMWLILGDILGLYRDNGKEHGNYCLRFTVYSSS